MTFLALAWRDLGCSPRLAWLGQTLALLRAIMPEPDRLAVAAIFLDKRLREIEDVIGQEGAPTSRLASSHDRAAPPENERAP